MPVRPVSLKVRALQWLAQREHSPQELRDRLLRVATEPVLGEAGGCDEAEVDAIVAWLEASGYLSRKRYVESRIHARQSRYGNRRIEHELRQHGVEPDAATRQALRDSEVQRAREVWQRKYGVVAADAAARVRQMRFLVGRGFSPEIVRQVVRAAERGEPAEP